MIVIKDFNDLDKYMYYVDGCLCDIKNVIKDIPYRYKMYELNNELKRYGYKISRYFNIKNGLDNGLEYGGSVG